MDEEVLKYSSEKYIPKDNYKNKEYYLNKLKSINERIKKFNMSKNSENSNRLDSVINDLIIRKIHILYVLNAEFEEIQQLVELYSCNLNKFSKTSKLYYNSITDMLSMGLLFDISKEKLEFIKSNMIEEKYIDAVLD